MAKLTANGNSLILEINGINNQFKNLNINARFDGLNEQYCINKICN